MPGLCSAVATATTNTAPRYMCHRFGCTPELMKRGQRPKKGLHMSSLILRKTSSCPGRRKKGQLKWIKDTQKGISAPCVSANASRLKETSRGGFYRDKCTRYRI